MSECDIAAVSPHDGAALRRASLDLTRALAKMRRGEDLAEYHRKMIRSELSRLRYLRSK